MVDIGISAFTANSAIFVYNKAGVLSINITDDMVRESLEIGNSGKSCVGVCVFSGWPHLAQLETGVGGAIGSPAQLESGGEQLSQQPSTHTSGNSGKSKCWEFQKFGHSGTCWKGHGNVFFFL